MGDCLGCENTKVPWTLREEGNLQEQGWHGGLSSKPIRNSNCKKKLLKLIIRAIKYFFEKLNTLFEFNQEYNLE